MKLTPTRSVDLESVTDIGEARERRLGLWTGTHTPVRCRFLDAGTPR